ncbi:MAG: hypothetical protein ABSB71_11160 [Candidatus Bathyarchaeia archaeon]
MTKGDTADVLRGTTLDVYRLMLKTRKPLGIREIQRVLKLSSPSVAQYHLAKLEYAGLLKKEGNNYILDKIFLENCIKISHLIIPKYLFYTIFALVAFFMELTFLRSDPMTREFFFTIIITLIFFLIFCYETAKIWLKGSL